MPVEHFRSKEAYRKFNAYRHIHGIPAPNLETAVVAGKPHKVKHTPRMAEAFRKERRAR
jgi:hypothetical protein